MINYKLVRSILAGLLLIGALGPAYSSDDTSPSGTVSDSVPEKLVGTTRSGEQINWYVISSGGTDGSSINFGLTGTVAQTAAGSGSSTNFILSHGYWQAFGGGSGSCCQQRGDVNDDGNGPDISDLVSLVNYMFGGHPYPGCEDSGYKAEADINGDLVGPDIADLVAMVNFMFGGCPTCLVPCP